MTPRLGRGSSVETGARPRYAPITDTTDFTKTTTPPPVHIVGGVVVLEDVAGAGACRADGLAAPVAARAVTKRHGAFKTRCA